MRALVVLRMLMIVGGFLSLSVMTGCTYFNSKTGLGRPGGFMMEIDYGSPDYRQGYKDGCASGYSGYGDSFNRFFHTWQQDPEKVKNPVYYQVWRDAYTYCAFAAMMHAEMGLGNWR